MVLRDHLPDTIAPAATQVLRLQSVSRLDHHDHKSDMLINLVHAHKSNVNAEIGPVALRPVSVAEHNSDRRLPETIFASTTDRSKMPNTE